MKILVTGSSGFIGSPLCERLIADGHEVRGFDNKCESGKKIHCTAGDIRNKDLLSKAVDSVDLVVHLIAMHHDFGISNEEYFEINEKGTADLMRCCSEAGIKKFIFFSSVAVYGTQPGPTNEKTVPKPDTPYGKSKLAAERVAEGWQKENPERQVIVIRPTVVFGPKNYANVYNLINQIYQKQFRMVGDGDNIKSMAYVENLVEATRFLMNHMKPGLEIYNYSDEPQMSTKEIVREIAESASVNIPRLRIPLWLAVGCGSVFDLLGKITRHNYPITGNRIRKFCTATYHKANKLQELGFHASVTLRSGIRETVHWYIQQQK